MLQRIYEYVVQDEIFFRDRCAKPNALYVSLPSFWHKNTIGKSSNVYSSFTVGSGNCCNGMQKSERRIQEDRLELFVVPSAYRIYMPAILFSNLSSSIGVFDTICLFNLGRCSNSLEVTRLIQKERERMRAKWRSRDPSGSVRLKTWRRKDAAFYFVKKIPKLKTAHQNQKTASNSVRINLDAYPKETNTMMGKQ